MYSISQIIADSKGVVVALNWAYSNVDGTISNQLRLAEPSETAEMTPFGEVTEAVAVTWLEAQLGNTAEEFDAAIAKRKEEQEYADSLSAYVNNDGKFEPVVEPVEEQQD
mgnify:FL=1|jgi:hypothetical protein